MSSSPPPSTTRRHLLVFPFPAQGHMLPLLDLTHHLASHGGFTITILVTPKNLSVLHPLLSAHSSDSVRTLVLPLPHHPKLPNGVENIKDIGNHGNVPILLALRQLHDPIVEWFNSHSSPPNAIISDFFLGWTQSLADRLQIPRIVFYSSGAFLVNVMDYCWIHTKTTNLRSSITIPNIPNSPSFEREHWSFMSLKYQDSDPDWVLLRDDAMANANSWGSVFNTFENLEHDYLEHLRKERGEGRVFGVGPLNLIGDKDGRNPIRDSSLKVLTWLDGCPDDSVVYVCFGSQKKLNRQQMEALASGLEKSGTRFVWVVQTIHQTDGGFNGIPIGFEDRVSDRGILVKGWAPQVAILNHRAVGGFLSHCGWNSVLESIVGGVMILGWPMEADQFINARLLVEELGVAVRVCEGTNSVPESDELGKVIAESMSGDSPEKMKAKALKREAVEAVRSNGSSWKDMQDLVNKLIHLPLRT
ncbi:UDP-glycosyltransferase 89A2-like isoform X2 [Benincasa hispida]|uniref:UDP-glycosyltransferase 89A2-like isoform X1 n=1 Tax=Benincasa hispida TaxID=102211 RepID=UPI0019017EBC|nr:UDP-glycosyltransferase 89A2-like isoform X1 [Benincasa hispida]XP_038892837.1 UDP-glycosyltransferase 89A2-like isoform X2 [Benincasa hispida]